MSSVQIRFFTTPAKQECLEEALFAVGAQCVTYEDGADQPILEPKLNETPLWNELVISAMFSADIDVKSTLAALQHQVAEELPHYKVEILEDKDWIREWMDSYQPMQFGEKLWICPSWCQPPNPAAINILLDPGLAFGTGTHPTTAMCLRQLSQLDLHDLSVIDFGCGSGILAIAALMSGASNATGIDIDPQALLASRDNAQRNNIDAERFPLYLSGSQPQITADLVLANILAGPLVELTAELTAMTNTGGLIILSGVLKEQAPAIVQAYAGFSLNIVQQDDWVCLWGQKK